MLNRKFYVAHEESIPPCLLRSVLLPFLLTCTIIDYFHFWCTSAWLQIARISFYILERNVLPLAWVNSGAV